ncbi:MAG: MFS transporter [Acidobacteria bacterium]|nr:MFS transporter [Acidobacteriota bacterium]MBU1475507.1 MFS transporter [Acidobacteriota bacterium]MBU2437856.1 MFS transporter [Acidobacteriota bacterium]MCG2815340.1 MFS transporter [Candidatus Aminicenantes bacterium]
MNESMNVFKYRWVMLGVFMLVIAINQLLWISFASITGAAAAFYGVSDLAIGLLSMVFMIVFIVISIPASWVIDTYGIRVGVGIGVALTGIFGLLRGVFAADYTWVLVSQIGIAIGQPFILNAISKIAGRWFPMRERATAAGLGSLAMYAGIFAGLAVTPMIVKGSSIPAALMIYGAVSMAATAVFALLARERPPVPVGPEERSLVFDGLKSVFRNQRFILLTVLFFIGLGVFNAVTTWIEDIVRPRGFSMEQAGMIGGLMVIGGIVGAVVIPPLSDRLRRRVPFILLALGGAIPGLIGITFATSYPLLLVSAFILGAFLLASGPLGFQYGAEITYPAPEGTSNGLLLLAGQVSGIAFIIGMDMLKSSTTGSMTLPLIILTGAMAAALLLATRLTESVLVRNQ